MFQKISILLFRFPETFHGLILLLTGYRLTRLIDGSYTWLTRAERAAVKLQGGTFSDEENNDG